MKAIKNILQKHKKLVIALVAATGCIMILLSYMQGDKVIDENFYSPSQDELYDYGKMLENKLCNSLSRLTGENTLEVMITFSGTFETIYENNNNSQENQVLYSSSSFGTNTQPAVVKKNCPKISGVMIVCMKKLDKSECLAIKKAASTVLNISQSKIYIIGGEQDHGKNS